VTPEELDAIEKVHAVGPDDRMVTLAQGDIRLLVEEVRRLWTALEHARWQLMHKAIAEREACIAIADDVMRAVHSGAEVAEEIRERIRARGEG